MCCCSDASRQPGCAVDIVRWPDTVGDSGAAVCGSSGGGVTVCPSIFATLAKMTSSLNPPCCHLFVAVPTPAGSRDVRLTLCDGPTLSETRGRPFVTPRAAAVLMTRASVFVFGFSALCVCLGVCVCVHESRLAFGRRHTWDRMAVDASPTVLRLVYHRSQPQRDGS